MDSSTIVDATHLHHCLPLLSHLPPPRSFERTALVETPSAGTGRCIYSIRPSLYSLHRREGAPYIATPRRSPSIVASCLRLVSIPRWKRTLHSRLTRPEQRRRQVGRGPEAVHMLDIDLGYFTCARGWLSWPVSKSFPVPGSYFFVRAWPFLFPFLDFCCPICRREAILQLHAKAAAVDGG